MWESNNKTCICLYERSNRNWNRLNIFVRVVCANVIVESWTQSLYVQVETEYSVGSEARVSRKMKSSTMSCKASLK